MPIDPSIRYLIEERAAILEYDAGMDRRQAENEALRQVAEMIRQNALQCPTIVQHCSADRRHGSNQ